MQSIKWKPQHARQIHKMILNIGQNGKDTLLRFFNKVCLEESIHWLGNWNNNSNFQKRWRQRLPELSRHHIIKHNTELIWTDSSQQIEGTSRLNTNRDDFQKERIVQDQIFSLRQVSKKKKKNWGLLFSIHRHWKCFQHRI